MKHSIAHHIVSRETFEQIDRLYEENQEAFDSYINLLLWWNERINLVSRDVSRETIIEHIRHSLLLTQQDIYKKADFIVDSGTGGGLPGLPLAIASPSKQFLLNDIVSKKVLAVKQIARKLGLQNLAFFDKSIDQLTLNKPFLLISKHAFKINTLFRLTSKMPWSSMVFYKGISFEAELDGITKALKIDVYNLFQETPDNFYKDKVLIVVSR